MMPHGDAGWLRFVYDLIEMDATEGVELPDAGLGHLLQVTLRLEGKGYRVKRQSRNVRIRLTGKQAEAFEKLRRRGESRDASV